MGSSKSGKTIGPDVLIPYTVPERELGDSSISIITVRPETNKVNYEAVIIKSTAPFANVIHMANLSGMLINKKGIVACHYSSQLQFAVNGKEEMEKYPEMIRTFEKKFDTPFKDAKIIGSYEAILDFKLKKSADDLFETMVPGEHFLELFGQTIKKIDVYYVLNYDIPAILTRHDKGTDMFLVAIRMKDSKNRFSDLNHVIYENMRKDTAINILGIDRRKGLAWYDQVRRTYHISRSHIEAMFDLTDYVFKDESERILFSDTPLGRRLVEKKIMTKDQVEERLNHLKQNPLVYMTHPGNGKKETLANIISEGRIKKLTCYREKTLEECCKIISTINWEKSMELAE